MGSILHTRDSPRFAGIQEERVIEMATTLQAPPAQKIDPKAIVSNKADLKALLSAPAMIASMSDVLPKHVTPARIVKMAMVAATREPKLLQCTQLSFMRE